VVVEKAASANSRLAAALAVSESATALTAYSETTEGETVVAEAEKGETERMREKVGDTALGGIGVQPMQTTEMVAEGVEETSADPAITGQGKWW
jgi:hypothetical protein